MNDEQFLRTLDPQTMVGGTPLGEVMESMPAATIIGMLVTAGFAAAMVYTVWKEKQEKIAADKRRLEESDARYVRLRRDAEERFEREAKQAKERMEEYVEEELARIDNAYLPVIAIQDGIIKRANALKDVPKEIDVPKMPSVLLGIMADYGNFYLTPEQHSAIIEEAEYIKKVVIQYIYNRKKAETERVKKHFDLHVPDVKIDMWEVNDTTKNNRANVKNTRISKELLEKIYAWNSGPYMKSTEISGYPIAIIHTPPYPEEVINSFKTCANRTCGHQATHGFTSAAEGYISNEDASKKRMFCKEHAPDGHRFIEVRYGGGSGLYFGILAVLVFAAVVVILICIIYQMTTPCAPKKTEFIAHLYPQSWIL